MPPELKKPINSLAEITCENCVFSYIDKAEPICCNPDSPDWYRESNGYCSEGQWLWFGSYLYDHGVPDAKLHLCDYQELYQEFARKEHG